MRNISYKAMMSCHTLNRYDGHNQPQDGMGKDGDKKMATLKEEALAYQPPQTLNIADLDKFPIDIELKDGDGKSGEGVEFTYKYATIEGKDYRVAGSIIGGIKALLEKMPNLTHVGVIKQGSGMNTKYQVVPVVE